MLQEHEVCFVSVINCVLGRLNGVA